jgi:mRNA (guanine-N7-)-methyltransferase
LQLEAREREEEAARNAESMQLARVEEKVRSHYNDKKDLGKEWRNNSKIKGLRAFNNWVKSTLIQKFSPRDDFDPRRPSADPNDHLVVLDMGCGKGGDLLKWKSAPQEVGFYLGVDSANVSIIHARDRYNSMLADQRRGRRSRDGRKVFEAEFQAMDCWTTPLDTIPMARRIGYDPNVGPGVRNNPRFSPAGFDVVSMMFCMHYAFETEAKCRQMLRNVAGALKPGGRFIGTIPSSDVISERVRGKDTRDKLPENEEHGVQEWGNSIYRVKFSNPPPRSGTFRPYWGWEYNFFLEEAVEEVPEYVVPWEAFRGIAEDYGLELEYKKPFHNVWEEEKDQSELRVLSERMGVRRRDGSFALGDDEWEACGKLTGPPQSPERFGVS